MQPGNDAATEGPVAPPDAASDIAEARPPDVAIDHGQEPDTGTSGCPADCSQLPHTRPGVAIYCVSGVCAIPYNGCADGFSHCSATPNVGCETDLSRPDNCGYCGRRCSGTDLCQPFAGTFYCTPVCQAPAPNACGVSCVDFQTDTNHCGGCDNSCYVSSSTAVACQQGHCAVVGCVDSTFADCDGQPGCETMLGAGPNCGACNDPACALANTMFTCADGGNCGAAVCLAGYANCNATSADCETPFTSTAAPAGCLPQYVSSVPLATQELNLIVTAVAPDGSVFIAGTFSGAVDFDASAGKDIRTATSTDGYITKLKADGTYAWTAALTGRGSATMTAIAVTPAGGIVATGYYQDSIDLDPGPAADIHFTTSTFPNDTFVVELAADGSEVWGRTFESTSFDANGSSTGIAVDGAGAVAVAGYFSGTVDFDPGPGTDSRTAVGFGNNGFLVKLTGAGDLAWARVVDDTGCTSTLAGVAIATDGSIWSTGTVTAETATCALTTPNSSTQSGDVLVMKVDPAGDSRRTWAIGETGSNVGNAIAAGRDGAMYIAGEAYGAVDMDPGPSVARRWLGSNGSGGFVLKLAADGTFVWARVLGSTLVNSMAGTADGGVILSGSFYGGFVSRLTADGASAWTFTTGGSATYPTSVSSNGATFAVGGRTSGSEDFDPGPSIDLVYGDVAFVSRFTF